jgi:hypothetical protein
MSASQHHPVLIIGGSGFVGSKAAQTLRRLQPDLPIAIGGRDRDRAEAMAEKIGKAEAVVVDLERRDLGLDPARQFSAVALFLKEQTYNALKYARDHRLPYVGISTGAFELGPELAHHIHAPNRAPVLMASHWLVGAATFATLAHSRDFAAIDDIKIVGVLDEQDMGGPAAAADFERFMTFASKPLILKDGHWRFVDGADAGRSVTDRDGVTVQALSYTPFDVLSLAARTDARSVRFDYVYGESSARRRGESFATEVIVEIDGTLKDGSKAHRRLDLFHPEGQAPISALGVALGVERLLGLTGGEPVAPGLYFPDSIIDPVYAVRRLKEFGTDVRQS